MINSNNIFCHIVTITSGNEVVATEVYFFTKYRDFFNKSHDEVFNFVYNNLDITFDGDAFDTLHNVIVDGIAFDVHFVDCMFEDAYAMYIAYINGALSYATVYIDGIPA